MESRHYYSTSLHPIQERVRKKVLSLQWYVEENCKQVRGGGVIESSDNPDKLERWINSSGDIYFQFRYFYHSEFYSGVEVTLVADSKGKIDDLEGRIARSYRSRFERK